MCKLMLGSQGLACSLPERVADCEVQARPGIAQHTDFNSLMSGELENCKIIQGSQNVDFAIPARVATLNVQSHSRNAKPLFFFEPRTSGEPQGANSFGERKT
jgi:hypothetical protein